MDMEPNLMDEPQPEENSGATDNIPLLPVHTKQAATALALLLFYSFLMFTTPFLMFFATKYGLEDYFNITGFYNTGLSVLVAVVTVNVIIVFYAYQAYYEKEYDDDGNEIVEGEQMHVKDD